MHLVDKVGEVACHTEWSAGSAALSPQHTVARSLTALNLGRPFAQRFESPLIPPPHQPRVCDYPPNHP
jgi:hypothetical protein